MKTNQVASQAVKRIFCVSMCVIGDVSNPQLVKEEVVPAKKLVLTSCGEEGDCVSKKKRRRDRDAIKKRDEIERTQGKTGREKGEEKLVMMSQNTLIVSHCRRQMI